MIYIHYINVPIISILILLVYILFIILEVNLEIIYHAKIFLIYPSTKNEELYYINVYAKVMY